jgi:hypothetical protein
VQQGYREIILIRREGDFLARLGKPHILIVGEQPLAPV